MEAYRDKSLSPRQRAEDLLGRMTVPEKVGQLTQRLYGFGVYQRQGEEIRLVDAFKEEVARYSGLGTIYGLYRADPWSGKNFDTGLDGVLAPKVRNQVQRYVLEHSRLGIPVLMSTECPHGHQALDGYLLPVNLAAGATFSPALLEAACAVSGRQLREMGVDLALVSALDVLRDPRWGRSEECFGEDPLLASRMARAAVRGVQSQGVDVVAKHLCAQGETTGGVNASAARIGPRELREIHLPPVKACVEAGARGFMAAYNEIDGIYCHANRWLLTDLLRGEYGFEGFVMSDGVAIDQLDAVTGDRTVSGALALNAGVDMGLWDTGFAKLEEALEKGLVSMERLDEAVLRILEIKFRRGLFDEPFVPENNHWQVYTPEAFPQTERLADESAVLLKNETNLLPFDESKPLRVLVTGPNADAIYNQLGDYTPPVRPGSGVTVLQGLRERARDTKISVTYAPGCPPFAREPLMIEGAVERAWEADVIVAVLGGTSSRFAGGEFMSNGALKTQDMATMDCGENVDSSLLALPGDQLRLLERLHRTGKPVVTVLIGGRPYAMGKIDRCSQGILCCFYPGPMGGRSVAKLLFGDLAPAGRLPASLPDRVGQLPVYYNFKDSYRGMSYYDSKARPKYSFGCGLTYTQFAYRLEEAPGDLPREGAEALHLRVTVQNTGARGAHAVPQLYLHRTQGAVTSRVRALCDFTKLYLEPGQEETLTLTIPREALCQWNWAMEQELLPGKVEWFLADGGKEWLTGSFRVK